MSGYAVEIKPSARRINEAAGEYVNHNGATREFDSKRRARAWAEAVSSEGGAVRVQDAAPNDPAPIDGYLVADPVPRQVEKPDRPDLETEPLDAF